jgi:hypothetical protein
MQRVDGVRAPDDAPALAGALMPAVAATLCVATLFLVPTSGLDTTTYAGATVTTQLADGVAGLGLVGVGLLVCAVRPDRRAVRIAASLAACGWFASTWVGWTDAPPVARSIGLVVEPW